MMGSNSSNGGDTVSKAAPKGFFVISGDLAEELGKELIERLEMQADRVVVPPNLGGKKVFRISTELAQALIDWRLLERPEELKAPLVESLVGNDLTPEIQAMEAMAAMRRNSRSGQ